MSRDCCWIHTISPEEAGPELGLVYRKITPRGNVANVLQVQSLDPVALAAHYALYRHLLFSASPLSRSEREMIAVAVSMKNHCEY
ncbi:MAG: carboxymuconolactone decarboxylase family protein [Candidatus Baltobacteraceae bacterium]